MDREMTRRKAQKVHVLEDGALGSGGTAQKLVRKLLAAFSTATFSLLSSLLAALAPSLLSHYSLPAQSGMGFAILLKPSPFLTSPSL